MDKIESIIRLLRRYAEETGTIVRSTSDISPLEEWLLMRLSEEPKTEDPTTKALMNPVTVAEVRAEMDKEKAWKCFKQKIPRTILNSSFDNYFKQAYLDSLEGGGANVRGLSYRLEQFASIIRENNLYGNEPKFCKKHCIIYLHLACPACVYIESEIQKLKEN